MLIAKFTIKKRLISCCKQSVNVGLSSAQYPYRLQHRRKVSSWARSLAEQSWLHWTDSLCIYHLDIWILCSASDCGSFSLFVILCCSPGSHAAHYGEQRWLVVVVQAFRLFPEIQVCNLCFFALPHTVSQSNFVSHSLTHSLLRLTSWGS